MHRAKLFLLLTGVPAIAAALLLLAASLLPLRFDLRTFQTQARLESLGLPRGVDFLVMTSDNEIGSAEISGFALPQWSFPHGARHWLTLKERSGGVWNGGFLGVDVSGSFHQPTITREGWSWSPAAAPAWLADVLEHGALLFDSAATRMEFEARLPVLTHARQVYVLGAQERPRLPIAAPSLRFSPISWVRLTAVLGFVFVSIVFMYVRAKPPLRLFAACVGAVAACAVLLAGIYVMGQFWPHAWYPAVLALWISGIAVVVAQAPQLEIGRPSGRTALALALLLVAYAVITMLRLDFDGDTYTTYLQVARYYYWAGRHVPQDPGIASLVQGSVYPPGFAMLLASPLWITDQVRDASFALGPQTSDAVLLYRWQVIGLNLAVLIGFAEYLRTLPGGSLHAAVASVVAMLFAIPTFRGQHTAAETLLVPMLGMALLAVLAGRRFDQPILAAAGLFLGGFLMFVKLDGLPFLVLLVLPAAATVRTGWNTKRELAVAVGLFAGLVPWLVWRASDPSANASFHAAAPAQVLAEIPAIAVVAFKLLVKHELWFPLLVALPCAIVWRWRSGLRSVLPAAGIIVLSCTWIAVYAFSALGAMKHIETSFPRIMLGPALAAIIFALETLCLNQEEKVG